MSLGLFTDLYELTMAASYLRRGMTQPATFSLFARDLPPGRGYLVAAGLEDALRRLEAFALDDQDVDWLIEQRFPADAIEALRGLHFTGDVLAIPEGHVVFPDEPLLEVTAPLPEAQLVETLMLNAITFQTVLATKSTRCRVAAAGRADLVDFSFRRTHGVEAGFAAARAGAIAGFIGTSNVEASRRLGIPAVGTMAHSYIQAFATEREAFVAYAEDFPDRATFLVDTFDTRQGIEIALDVIESHGLHGRLGIRLDSGDLLELSRYARHRLDEAGRHDVTIVASGGLDEFAVQELLDAGAPIDVFGVGTRIGVSADAPALDTAYKLVEYDGRPVMKLSTGKATRPGPKQVYRSDRPVDDLLTSRCDPAPYGRTPLLVPVMRGGARTGPPEHTDTPAARLTRDLAALPQALLDLRCDQPSPVCVSHRLATLTDHVRATHRPELRPFEELTGQPRPG